LSKLKTTAILRKPSTAINANSLSPHMSESLPPSAHQTELVAANSLEARIVELQHEHQTLDEHIHQLSAIEPQDQLQLQRLKKRKLMLKDQITHLESQLTPNISA